MLLRTRETPERGSGSKVQRITLSERMRVISALMFLLIEALVFGQGFNRRYDYQQQGHGQDGLNIERTGSGFLVISTGSDLDSLGPDSFLTHASVVLTRIAYDGTLLWEKRAYRPGHSAFAGWANCCDSILTGGHVVGGGVRQLMVATRSISCDSMRRVIRFGHASLVIQHLFIIGSVDKCGTRWMMASPL